MSEAGRRQELDWKCREMGLPPCPDELWEVVNRLFEAAYQDGAQAAIERRNEFYDY